MCRLNPEISILDVTDRELRKQFWPSVTFDKLKQNAEKIKSEILAILESNERMKLRPLLKKLFKIRSRVHKWDIFRAFWDEKWQIVQYGWVRKWRKWFSEAQRRLFEIWLSSSDWFSQVARYIKEVSISNGEFVFQKWYPYAMTEVFLQDIWIYPDSHIMDSEDAFVVSLSQNENGMQEWKLNFFCIPHRSIDNETYDWTFVNLEELDQYFHPKTIIFRWVDTSWNLVFSQSWSRKKIHIPSDKILKWFRKKDTLIHDDETEPVIAWEEGSEHVSIIQYWEKHPKAIFAQLMSELDHWFFSDAYDMLWQLPKWCPEYLEAERILDEDAAEQTRMLMSMTDRWEFPTW